MNIYETIKNIRSKCDNYIDPDLVVMTVNDNCTLGENNLSEIEECGISPKDKFEDKVLKILKKENIFIIIGMLSFIPILNECDIFSFEDETIKLTKNEFENHADEKEVYFGMLIKKNTNHYIIGTTDLCNCKIDSCFREVKKDDGEFYKKLEEIIQKMIIN